MNTFIRKNLLLILILTLVLTLVACTGNEEAEAPCIQEEKAQENISDGTKRVGQEGFGFITIPEYWVNFQNINSPNVDVAFSDPTGRSIINLFLFDDADPIMFLSTVAYGMENEGAENIEFAIVDLSGKEVFQVYGYYPHDSTWLVAWAFTGCDGNLRFITAEAPPDNIFEVVAIIENTYSYKE